jgi:hypothetical protein
MSIKACMEELLEARFGKKSGAKRPKDYRYQVVVEQYPSDYVTNLSTDDLKAAKAALKRAEKTNKGHAYIFDMETKKIVAGEQRAWVHKDGKWV